MAPSSPTQAVLAGFPAQQVPEVPGLATRPRRAHLGSALIGLQGIFAAAAVANGLAGIAAYFWLRRILAGGSLEQQVSKRSEVSGEMPVAGE